ncbi:APC family permease [Nocardiopsis sp. NPDC049922]|uniref:APC family permease n=1 Tax=Nocardiopsis sp. NPDC049922 TaxID=3155157 RepID=UPI0033ED4022
MERQSVEPQRPAPTSPAPAPGRLKSGAVGAAGIVFFVLSAQAPLTGVAGAVPIAVGIGNGPGVPAAYTLAGLLILLFAVGFTAMGRHVVNAGAFSAYIGTGLGRTTGLGSAGVALFAYCAIQAAMYGLYGATMSGLVASFTGADTPWWMWSLLTMAVVQALGASGVEIGARVLMVLVVAEFSILLVFALVTLVTGGGPEGLNPAGSFSADALLRGAPGVAVMFAVASMFGFEAGAIYGEEARDPERTVPRATYTAVILVTGFFALASWMLISSHGASAATGAARASLESDPAEFVLTPVAALLGGWVHDVLPVLLATSLFAGILAFHNSASRYIFALGRERVFSPLLLVVNRRQAPWLAGAVQTALALLLVTPFAVLGLDPVLTLFSWFSGTAVLAMMAMYLLTSVSVIVFFRRERADERRWSTLVAPALAAVGLAGAVLLILINFTTLVGGSPGTAALLALTVPAVMAATLGLVRATRHRRPAPVG